jgi:hypothetical protein
LQGSFIDKLSGSHKVDKNSFECGISFKGFDAQVPEIENIVLKGSDHAVDISQENNTIVLHENVFFFGSQFQIAPSTGIILFINWLRFFQSFFVKYSQNQGFYLKLSQNDLNPYRMNLHF